MTRRLVLFACVVAATLGTAACGLAARRLSGAPVGATTLPEEELRWARAAWKYFDINLSPETGVAPAVNDFSVATMWHVADTIAALESANALGLLSDADFDARMSRVIRFLNTMPLAAGRLPNKAYLTGQPVMASPSGDEGELGWSAVDLGRLLLWLRITRDRHPLLAEYVDRAVLRWDMCGALDKTGQLQSSVKSDSGMTLFQEGRYGYEEYAAAGFSAWGLNASAAAQRDPVTMVSVGGVGVPTDPRATPEDASGAVVTLPFALYAIELGWDEPAWRGSHHRADLAHDGEAIVEAQRRRYATTGILTARTDHQLKAAPFFVYDSIISGSSPWATVADDGTPAENTALVATRAAFPMWAAWPSSYTKTLLASVSHLVAEDRGWFEGRDEQTGGIDDTRAATTNAVILESIWYRAHGPLLRGRARSGYFSAASKDASAGQRCFASVPQ